VLDDLSARNSVLDLITVNASSDPLLGTMHRVPILAVRDRLSDPGHVVREIIAHVQR
jgi:hypothetical protein